MSISYIGGTHFYDFQSLLLTKLKFAKDWSDVQNDFTLEIIVPNKKGRKL